MRERVQTAWRNSGFIMWRNAIMTEPQENYPQHMDDENIAFGFGMGSDRLTDDELE